MVSRRSVLIGIGAAVAGGGALFATGAFTEVEAQRTVEVNTAGDAGADLGIEVHEDYDGGGDTASIELGEEDGGLGPGRTYSYPVILAVTNNTGLGDLDISLDYEAEEGGLTLVDADESVESGELGFEFEPVEGHDLAEDEAFAESEGETVDPEGLVAEGQAVAWELEIVTPPDLGDDDDFEIDLTITAETQD